LMWWEKDKKTENINPLLNIWNNENIEIKDVNYDDIEVEKIKVRV
jgi:hypothetical protein